jgi:predicted kinase
MRFMDLNEGPNDPGIFKAVFLAGGPGSGKSFVATELGLAALGLRVVNSDDALEYLMQKHDLDLTMPPEQQAQRDVVRQRAKEITKKKQNLYLDGRLGLIIDGTAKDVNKMAKLKKELEAIGYQTALVFVNTSLRTALQRNNMRQRRVPTDIVMASHQQVQQNKEMLKDLFGSTYHEVNNEGEVNFGNAVKFINSFMQAPVTDLARDWISKAQVQKTVKEELSKKPKVYVDMDGVIANFYAGVTAATGHEEPRAMALQDIEDTMASFAGTDFFYKLPKYEQTDQLIAMVNAATDGDWYILSSPLKYDREGSAAHKARWVKDNLQIQPRGMHFTGDKAKYATQPDGTPNILIDDYPQYLNKWTDAGGIGVKYKGHVGNIEDVKATLDKHLGDEVTEVIRKVKGGYRLLSKDGEKNLGTYPTRAGAEKRERQVQYFKHQNEGAISEEVTQSNLDEIERYADKLFSTLGIDVSFTRHFIDRVNDERNQKPISAAELIRLFRKEYQRWGKPIAQMGPESEAVLKDMQTDINVPFVLKWDRRNNELDLVAKTVMRKPNFKSPDPVFPVESQTSIMSAITELADNPYDYSQNVKTPDKRAYRFQTDAGQLYRVQVFNRRNDDENKLEIHFDLTDMKTGKPETGKTGTGDAVRVFSTVGAILQKEVDQQDPTGIIIASKADDDSRVKLYRTLARRAAKMMSGFEVAGERTVTGADGNPYITIELKQQ